MSRRLTILAGAGALVPEIISGAKAAGDDVQVLPLVDRADLGLAEVFRVADLPRLIWRITSFRSTHVTMVGGLHATQSDRQAFKRFAKVRGPSGDAALLKVAERLLSLTGARVVGAEAIVPDILATEGRIGGPPLDPQLLPVARFALDTARACGLRDEGQAVVVSGDRVVAVEDSAGTDALLASVAGRAGGMILAKALKPQQSRLTDRPAVGPETVRGAKAAGIVAIVVEAGGAVIIDRAGLDTAANAAGIAVIGLALDGR